MTRYPRRGLLFVLACLAGCGAGSTSSTSLSLGRSLEVGKKVSETGNSPQRPSQGAAAELAANHVENKGVLLAIISGEGPAHGQWVVVTQEQTTGSGPYSGLPTSPHVTLAKTVRLRNGFAVSQWNPQS
jgi:hypothetical protein